MRKFFEKIVEGGLLISGSVSSFTILLIVFFLLKEAGGLFNTPATEEGYVLAVNKSNDVGKLSPEKIMDIFDGNITNWKDISGMDQNVQKILDMAAIQAANKGYAYERWATNFNTSRKRSANWWRKNPVSSLSSPNSIYWKTVSRERYCRKRRSH